MDIKNVKQTVQEIVNLSNDDPEMAHEKEDDLYLAVLEQVIAGNHQSKEMAKEALKTQMINYPVKC